MSSDGLIWVMFENYDRSRDVAETLRYYNKEVCSLFGSGMRRCSMKGCSHVLTAWDTWEEAKEAASYLARVQKLGCQITRIE